MPRHITQFFAPALFVATVFVSCKTKQTDTPAGTTADTVAALPAIDSTGDNFLTATMKNEGWETLFDGMTMQGWRPFRDAENNSWEIIDGTLHCKPADAANKRADLINTNPFENFELTFDWKIAPKQNSGVMFHIVEDFEQAFASGPEYQVIDDAGYPEKLKDAQHSGANYDMHAPTANVAKPAGEWNTGKIVVNGNHVEHWLNGTKVVDYDLNSDDWKKRHDASKWKKDFPGYAAAKTGYIGLQDHGGEVWYKNIFIKSTAQ